MRHALDILRTSIAKLRYAVLVALLVFSGAIHFGLNTTSVHAHAPTPGAPGHITAGDVATLTKRLRCKQTIMASTLNVGEILNRNSLQQYRNIQACYGESDFVMSKNGVLVASHDAALPGGCGTIKQTDFHQLRSCSLPNHEQVATIDDFLKLPLTEWYIDLKPTLTGDLREALQATKAAIKAVKQHNRAQGAVIMTYNAAPDIVALINGSGIRGSFKSYPMTLDEAKYAIDWADSTGLGALNMRVDIFPPEIVDYAQARQVTLLSWAGDTYKTAAQWQAMQAHGLERIIVAPIDQPKQSLSFTEHTHATAIAHN